MLKELSVFPILYYIQKEIKRFQPQLLKISKKLYFFHPVIQTIRKACVFIIVDIFVIRFAVMNGGTGGGKPFGKSCGAPEIL